MVPRERLPFRFRWDFEIIGMKRYSTFLRCPEQEPHHQMQFSVIPLTQSNWFICSTIFWIEDSFIFYFCYGSFPNGILIFKRILRLLYIYIYIYIYIVIHRQTVSFYQNSSVWLDPQDARSRDRNPSNFTIELFSVARPAGRSKPGSKPV